MRRVIWRLEEKNLVECSYKQRKRAIMLECGTDIRTVTHNIKNMIELGFIKRLTRWKFKVMMSHNDQI